MADHQPAAWPEGRRRPHRGLVVLPRLSISGRSPRNRTQRFQRPTAPRAVARISSSVSIRLSSVVVRHCDREVIQRPAEVVSYDERSGFAGDWTFWIAITGTASDETTAVALRQGTGRKMLITTRSGRLKVCRQSVEPRPCRCQRETSLRSHWNRFAITTPTEVERRAPPLAKITSVGCAWDRMEEAHGSGVKAWERSSAAQRPGCLDLRASTRSRQDIP